MTEHVKTTFDVQLNENDEINKDKKRENQSNTAEVTSTSTMATQEDTLQREL